jgi:hypothetical protein
LLQLLFQVMVIHTYGMKLQLIGYHFQIIQEIKECR